VISELCERFGITGRVKEAALEAQRQTATLTYDAQQRVQLKVLGAFIDEGIDESDLAGTTGTATTTPRARVTSRCSRASSARSAPSLGSRS